MVDELIGQMDPEEVDDDVLYYTYLRPMSYLCDRNREALKARGVLKKDSGKGAVSGEEGKGSKNIFKKMPSFFLGFLKVIMITNFVFPCISRLFLKNKTARFYYQLLKIDPWY